MIKSDVLANVYRNLRFTSLKIFFVCVAQRLGEWGFT